MKQIQEWLGHSDISTTANIYAHLDSQSKNLSARTIDVYKRQDFPLERSLEDCLKAVEVKSLSRYFDDQLDAAEELSCV